MGSNFYEIAGEFKEIVKYIFHPGALQLVYVVWGDWEVFYSSILIFITTLILIKYTIFKAILHQFNPLLLYVLAIYISV